MHTFDMWNITRMLEERSSLGLVAQFHSTLFKTYIRHLTRSCIRVYKSINNNLWVQITCQVALSLACWKVRLGYSPSPRFLESLQLSYSLITDDHNHKSCTGWCKPCKQKGVMLCWYHRSQHCWYSFVFWIAPSARRDSTAIAAGTVGTTVLEPGARAYHSLHLHSAPPFESLALTFSPDQRAFGRTSYCTVTVAERTVVCTCIAQHHVSA